MLAYLTTQKSSSSSSSSHNKKGHRRVYKYYSKNISSAVGIYSICITRDKNNSSIKIMQSIDYSAELLLVALMISSNSL